MKRPGFPAAKSRMRRWIGLNPGEIAVFFVYIAMVAIAISYYQQSLDEGREWVITRNFAIPHLVFHVLRYEGHPPLLYLLLWVPAHLHMPYAWINWLSAIVGAVSTYLLLRLSPFPFYVRALLPFCFALGYQEAVVARSYVLFPFLGFIAAHLYRGRPDRPRTMAITLSLLANVSFHGTLVAIGLAIAYALHLRHESKAEGSSGVRALQPRTLWQAGALFAASLALVAICIVPAKYSDMTPQQALTRILHRSQGPQAATSQATPSSITSPGIPSPAPSRSLPQRYARQLRLVFVYPISSITILSCLFELLVLVFLVLQRQVALLLPIVLLDYFLLFGFVDYRHTPLVWITLILVLWAAWESTPRPGPFRLQTAVALSLAMLCILQIPWTFGAIHYELHAATYPARMTAAYLKTLPPTMSIDGDKSVYALLPYLPAYTPIDRTGGRFADHASYATSATIDTLREHASGILLLNQLLDTPEAVARLRASGYIETNIFCGGPYFPNAPIGTTCFHVYARR